MSRFVAAVLPNQNRTWRVAAAFFIVLAMLLPGPLVARADGDEGRRFTTTATILIADPGGAERIGDSNRFKTTGELIFGCITGSTWDLIPVDGPSCFPIPAPSLLVGHSSVTNVSPNGRISGRATGSFNVGGLRGTYEGVISALYNPAGPYFPSGFPAGIYQIDDRGKWSAVDSQGNSARGTFTLHMEWNPAVGTLIGSITLTGSHNQSTSQAHDRDDKHGRD